MNRREWIRITEYFELTPLLEREDHIVLAVLTAQIVPLGLEIQCIQHARYSNGDVFLLPSYRSTALEEFKLPSQSFFRIKGKHKSQRFQLALEEALIRAATPGPIAIQKGRMPRIPAATRKSALQAETRNYSDRELSRMAIGFSKRRN